MGSVIFSTQDDSMALRETYPELDVRGVNREPHEPCLSLVPLSLDLPSSCQAGLRQRNSDNAEYLG